MDKTNGYNTTTTYSHPPLIDFSDFTTVIPSPEVPLKKKNGKVDQQTPIYEDEYFYEDDPNLKPVYSNAIANASTIPTFPLAPERVVPGVPIDRKAWRRLKSDMVVYAIPLNDSEYVFVSLKPSFPRPNGKVTTKVKAKVCLILVRSITPIPTVVEIGRQQMGEMVTSRSSQHTWKNLQVCIALTLSFMILICLKDMVTESWKRFLLNLGC